MNPIQEQKLREEWSDFIHNELFPGMSLINKNTIADWFIAKFSALEQEKDETIGILKDVIISQRKIFNILEQERVRELIERIEQIKNTLNKIPTDRINVGKMQLLSEILSLITSK